MGAVGAEALLPVALGALPDLLDSACPDDAGSSRVPGMAVPGGSDLLAPVRADPSGPVPTARVAGGNRELCSTSQQLQEPQPAPHVLYHQGSGAVAPGHLLHLQRPERPAPPSRPCLLPHLKAALGPPQPSGGFVPVLLRGADGRPQLPQGPFCLQPGQGSQGHGQSHREICWQHLVKARREPGGASACSAHSGCLPGGEPPSSFLQHPTLTH